MEIQSVLIPMWIERALAAANKPLSTILDLPELARTLSFDDVVFYAHLNHVFLSYNRKAQLFDHIAADMPLVVLVQALPYKTGEEKAWTNRLHDKFYALNAALGDTVNPYQLVDQLPITVDGKPQGTFESQYSYDIVQVDDGVFGVRPLLRRPDESPAVQDINALFNLIKQLRVYYPIHEVAKTASFTKYTNLLRFYQAA